MEREDEFTEEIVTTSVRTAATNSLVCSSQSLTWDQIRHWDLPPDGAPPLPRPRPTRASMQPAPLRRRQLDDPSASGPECGDPAW